MYDRKEKSIYKYVLYNNDYSNKERVNIGIWRNTNDEIGYYQKIEAYELVDAYKKNKLKGKLKDVASKLDEDSNAVIMLVKNKKLI